MRRRRVATGGLRWEEMDSMPARVMDRYEVRHLAEAGAQPVEVLPCTK